MSNLSSYNTITSDILLQNMLNFKSNPNLVQQYILNYLQGITNGQIDIVDPTNPFVFLLEASTINSAAAIQESIIATQRLYPSLARTTKDLYLHMDNTDYIDIFSTPAKANFTFLINKQELINNAIPVPNQPYSQVTIPANTYSTAGQYTFTMLYPINILYYTNGSILVTIDPSRPNPLQELGSLIIAHTHIVDPSGTEWIQFNLEISQFVITSNQYTLTQNEYFQETIDYSNLFYYCRVFYLDETQVNWVEIDTTYTDQVFNPTIPTALIQVLNGSIQVNIPQIYYDNNLIQSNIRIDIYTTLGDIDVNMASYNVDQYTNVFTAINSYEITNYVNAMANISYLLYSTDIATDGSNGVTFAQLKALKVNNALNGRLLPITNAQAQAYTQYQGFTLNPNVDVVTDRQFKAIQRPPASNNSFLVPSLNTSMISVIVDTTAVSGDNKVLQNGSVLIITPETVLLNQNGQVVFLTSSQRQQLTNLTSTNLVNQFNSVNYLYTPFYYMVNNATNEFIVRAYWMNNPSMSQLNYVSDNATTDHIVSTQSFTIAKTSTGFLVTLVNTGDSAYLALDPSLVFCQLAFQPYGQNTYAYMTEYAQPTQASGGGFIFQFQITTNFYFDINNTIDLDSFSLPLYPNVTIRSNLLQNMNILYGINETNVGYVPDNAQLNIFNNKFTSSNATVITNETINIQFGTYLNNLWTKATLIQSTPQILTYQNDVPMLYDTPVFSTNPITGSILDISSGEVSFNVLHNIGDPVLDANGNPIFAHYAGDPVMDENGKPITINNGVEQYIVEMVFYDGAYRIATDPNVTTYVQSATNTMVEWATTTMDEIDDNLFEQTSILYSPTNTNTVLNCTVDGQTSVVLNANLSPTINIYLSAQDYQNTNLQNQLSISAINVVRSYLLNTSLSKAELIDLLLAALSNVVTISVTGFFDNYGYVQIVDPKDTFILERINYLESTNVIGVKENINVLFFQV